MSTHSTSGCDHVSDPRPTLSLSRVLQDQAGGDEGAPAHPDRQITDMRYVAVAVMIAAAIWAVLGPPPHKARPTQDQFASRR